MKKQSIVIPHEHGGWAMVSVPFLIGSFAGKPQWMHLLLFLAWLFLYLSSYPFLQALKRKANRKSLLAWGSGYGIAALFFVVLPLLYYPALIFFGLPLFVLLLVNIWHARRKSERAIVNDLSAILIFSLGGAAAYLLGSGGWDAMMGLIVLFSFMHFSGSAFFVKTVFRERGNKSWIAYALIYHVLLLIIPWAIGVPWMILPYAFSAARAFLYAGKTLRPWKVGMIEIVGAVQFLVLSVVILRMLL